MKRIVVFTLICVLLCPFAFVSVSAADVRIKEIRLTVKEPAVGETQNLNITVETDPAGAIPKDGGDCVFQWYAVDPENSDIEKWTYLYESTKFEKGKYYGCMLSVMLGDGYCLDSSTTAKVNGRNSYGLVYQNEKIASVRFIWGPVGEESKIKPVDSIDVSVTAPKKGERPDYNVTLKADPVDGVTLFDAMIDWFECDTKDPDLDNWSYMNGDDTFKSNKYYAFRLMAASTDGYRIDPATKGRVNGDPTDGVYVSDYTARIFYVWEPFDDLTPIKSVNLYDITPPVIGEKPSMTYTVETDPKNALYLGDCVFQWYVCDTNDPDFDNWSYMYESTKFEEGKYYAIGFFSGANSEYYKMAEDTTASVNGNKCDISPYNGKSNCTVRYVWGPLKKPEKVKSFNVSFTEPKAGGKCNDHVIIYSEPAEAISKDCADITVSWLVYNEETGSWDPMLSGSVFEEGGKYALQTGIDFYSITADGYEADGSTVIRFNGGSLPDGGMWEIPKSEQPEESTEISEEPSEEKSEEKSEEASAEISVDVSEEPSDVSDENSASSAKETSAGDDPKDADSSVSPDKSEAEDHTRNEKGGISGVVPYIITFASAALVGGVGTWLVIKMRKKN